MTPGFAVVEAAVDLAATAACFDEADTLGATDILAAGAGVDVAGCLTERPDRFAVGIRAGRSSSLLSIKLTLFAAHTIVSRQ